MCNDCQEVQDDCQVKISVEYSGKKLNYELDDDSNLDDYVSIFRSILIFLTFNPEQASEIIKYRDENDTDID